MNRTHRPPVAPAGAAFAAILAALVYLLPAVSTFGDATPVARLAAGVWTEVVGEARAEEPGGVTDGATEEPFVDEGGRAEPLPDELEGIGVEENLGAQLPLDLTFTDSEGRVVRLGEYFSRKKPVLLNLVYYTCPMLCTLVLNGVVHGMQTLDWVPGQDYELVTISIDPSETPALAAAKKENYLEEYGREGAASGWHFLVATEENVRAVADTVGFSYRYSQETQEFIHTAATFVISPDGRVMRYLYGIEYEPQTFKLALLEASEGKIGSSLDRLILFCFHYDAESGRYAPVAVNIMRVGGAVSAVILGILLVVLWSRDLRRRRRETVEAGGRA